MLDCHVFFFDQKIFIQNFKFLKKGPSIRYYGLKQPVSYNGPLYFQESKLQKFYICSQIFSKFKKYSQKSMSKVSKGIIFKSKFFWWTKNLKNIFNHPKDASQYGNAGRFVNHSCDPNLVAVRVIFGHNDFRFPNVVFIAKREIEAGEELTLDYGDVFWAVKGAKIHCQCKRLEKKS